ncbi:hypothetical protein OKW41_004717 [Paraburkholderia sp. UCT70]
MRTCPSCNRPDWRSPGSRTRSVRTCQVLRPRRVIRALAIARSDVLPSATQTASAPGISFLSWLNGWPARTPADASSTSSRMPAHGSGPMWFAIPSSQWTCTTYSLPVSRRTRVKTQKYSVFGCRFTLPELPPGQHRAIWRVNFFEHRITHSFSHGLDPFLPLRWLLPTSPPRSKAAVPPQPRLPLAKDDSDRTSRAVLCPIHQASPAGINLFS